MKIIKRDGTINNFEVDKIKNAILKACQEIGKDMSDSEILNIVMNVVSNINSYMEENKLTEINVEQIQDFVEKALSDYKDILIAYKNYRRERNRIRDTKTDKVQYAYSDQEKESIIKSMSKNIKINRNKGIGEVDAIVLNETAMNPETRHIVQVNIDNISNMINSFEVWMDNDVTMRKEYIENNLDKYIIEE